MQQWLLLQLCQQQAFWPCSQPTSALSNFKATLSSSKPTVRCLTPVTEAPTLAQEVLPDFQPHCLVALSASQRCQPESAPTSLGKIRCSMVGTFPLQPSLGPSLVAPPSPLSSQPIPSSSPAKKCAMSTRWHRWPLRNFPSLAEGTGKQGGEKKSKHSDQVPKEPWGTGRVEQRLPTFWTSRTTGW